MFIGDSLRNNPDSIAIILEDNFEEIKEMYVDALALTFHIEATGEKSLASICTILAICLIYDIQEVKAPLSYEEEDEELIYKVGEDLFFSFTLEDMVQKNLLSRKKVNGEYLYTVIEDEKE